MGEMVKGIDCSRWQTFIKWSQMAGNGVKFAFIKATQNNFTDERFFENWANSKKEQILRGAYCFADYRYRAEPQARYMHKVISSSGDLGELPYVLDVEQLWQPVPPGKNMLSWMREFFEVADSLFGRRGIFYCNPSGIQHWLGLKTVPDFLSDRGLWLAHYGVNKPDFRPFPNWTFWQWTAKGNGKLHGAGSLDLDMNWFNGSEADLRAFAGLGGGVPVPPPVLSLEEKVGRLWNAHPELWN